jgi:predicted transcriptional regulator
MTTTPVSLRVTSEVLKHVDEEAKKQRRSRNFMINEILAQHFKPTTNGTTPTKKAGTR